MVQVYICDLRIRECSQTYGYYIFYAFVMKRGLLHCKTLPRMLAHRVKSVGYLMASGIKKEDAQALIIKGFLKLDKLRIPKVIKEDVEKTIALAKSGKM